MLKKLRWRFITISMIAFSAVIIVLLLVINIFTYQNTTKQLNKTMQSLINAETTEHPPAPSGSFPFPEFRNDFSPEFKYMLRFFSVYIDAQNEVEKVNQDYIASVSENEVINYVENVLTAGKTNGYYNSYRYAVITTTDGKMIFFLNAERELQFLKSLFLSTVGIAVCCLFAVFIIIVFLSKKAIAPYLRNLETQKKFITNAGHELKTPLTSISTSADVLAMEYENDEWIQNIQQQSTKMSKLIAQLISLSRLDEEQPFPEMVRFSLTDAIWEISEPFSSIAEAKGKEYAHHIEDNIILTGDKNTIQQMVSILLDNALKYSEENGKIRLDLYKRGKKIKIKVYNTFDLGSTPDLDRIFDRFYRADQSRTTKDSYGIGLSIAQSIAQNHGGYIKADCANDSSITFTVKI